MANHCSQSFPFLSPRLLMPVKTQGNASLIHHNYAYRYNDWGSILNKILFPKIVLMITFEILGPPTLEHLFNLFSLHLLSYIGPT